MMIVYQSNLGQTTTNVINEKNNSHPLKLEVPHFGSIIYNWTYWKTKFRNDTRCPTVGAAVFIQKHHRYYNILM